jgi:hypothetical protein
VDTEFVKFIFGTDPLTELGTKSTATMEEAASRGNAPKFFSNIDGYFLPESVAAIFGSGSRVTCHCWPDEKA